MKISFVFQIVKWIFAYHTLSALVFLTPAAEIGCFQVDVKTSPPIDCSCGPYWMDGTCGSGKTTGTSYPPTYKKCNPGDGINKTGGFKFCNNTNDFVATSYTCTTSVDYRTVAFCIALEGGTVAGCASCIMVPNPVSCFVCLGAAGGTIISGCFGCGIVSCSITVDKKAVRVEVYKDSSITCPSGG